MKKTWISVVVDVDTNEAVFATTGPVEEAADFADELWANDTSKDYKISRVCLVEGQYEGY